MILYLFDNAAIECSKLDDPIHFLQVYTHDAEKIVVNRLFLDVIFANEDTKDRIKVAGITDEVLLLSGLLNKEVELIDN